jgi:hypothetical protein
MATSHFSGAVDSVAGFSVNGTSVISSAGTVTSATSIVVGSTTISEAEVGVLDAVTPGTATASKAVVLDSSKGIATITSATITTLTAPTVNSTNVDAGASGTAGSVDIFPATAARGKVSITAANSAGDTTTTIVNASQAGARTFTIPDPGASASFAMLGASQSAVIGSTQAEIDLQCDASAQTETIAESGVVSVTKRVTKIASTGAGAVTLAAPDASMIGVVKIIEMISGEHDITLALTNVQGGSAATTATFSDINDALVLVGGVLKWHVVGESGVVLS